ncbi:unnamed protein product [Ceutorhynchus assimilis]|uniref:CCHC-type domain-containing protein n=1 Tax=Ceutorhynchus assimilis TaxID=467358 RepID=A0A9N9QQ28_9CUCU|nr:unnamed protein product [Ceutorhynchus assimilis]
MGGLDAHLIYLDEFINPHLFDISLSTPSLEQQTNPQNTNLGSHESLNLSNPFIETVSNSMEVDVTNAFTKTLEDLSDFYIKPNKRPTIFFHGFNYAMMTLFVRTLERYFNDSNILDSSERVSVGVSLLKGEARECGTLTEDIQLDMVYGLIHIRQIHEKVPRDKVHSFQDLLTQARLAEETFKSPDVSKITGTEFKGQKRYVYCKNAGHVKEECRKLKKAFELGYSPQNITKSTVHQAQANVQVQNAETAQEKSSPLSCYGCGAPGFIRSNCPNCST